MHNALPILNIYHKKYNKIVDLNKNKLNTEFTTRNVANDMASDFKYFTTLSLF